MEPHHGPIVRAEGADGVGQHLLEGEQDLMVQAAHQIPVSPEDLAQEQGRIVTQGPVVIQGVDGGCQRFQDAVHDAGNEAFDVGPQAQVGVLDEALGHVQKAVELLQVMAHRLDPTHNVDKVRQESCNL
uniref:Uncharacterized protein n=1 Tax=Micrurus lemniscatus lemniscatus TaxID=129467 RepID=A0A2D4JG11_MICLE